MMMISGRCDDDADVDVRKLPQPVVAVVVMVIWAQLWVIRFTLFFGFTFSSALGLVWFDPVSVSVQR
ncbi:hypothetical protein Hanom_Chr02g00142731 [Helianthus anomalus]